MKAYICLFTIVAVILSYSEVSAQKIGMNTTSPLWPVHVMQAPSTTLSDHQPLLFAEYTGTNAAHAIALQGKSTPMPDFGIGGDFEGGFIGAQGRVTGTGEANYYGLFGKSEGAGTGVYHGVFGYANGAGTNVGLLGLATGGTTNWAGFFGSGNVHVQNKLAVGTTAPVSPLHVTQGNAVLQTGDAVSTIEFVGTSPSQSLVAVRGRCVSGVAEGTGGYFEGGFIGVRGVVTLNTSGQVFGTIGYASGTGNGTFNGIQGSANGSGYNIGVRGAAFGGTTNWAGFFESGNVYIQNRLGLGTDNPLRQLHVRQGFNTYQNFDPIALIEYNGASLQKHVVGLQVKSQPASGFGIGMDVDAGSLGINVQANGGGNESTGVYAFATGSTQFGNKGVFSQVTSGPGINAAIHARAPEDENSFSGFFEEGNVFIGSKLGIGIQNPSNNLDIQDNWARANFISTNSTHGSWIVLDNQTPGAVTQGAILFAPSGGGPFGTIHYTSENNMGLSVGGDTRIHIRSNGLVGIGREASTNKLEVEGNASKSSAGDWLANSDARLKKNIESLDPKEMIEKLLALKGVTYEWNDDKTGTTRPEGTQYGFTAQNIQGVFPELVEEDANGYLQTAYSTYDAMIIESIRYLYEENKALRALLEQKMK